MIWATTLDLLLAGWCGRLALFSRIRRRLSHHFITFRSAVMVVHEYFTNCDAR